MKLLGGLVLCLGLAVSGCSASQSQNVDDFNKVLEAQVYTLGTKLCANGMPSACEQLCKDAPPHLVAREWACEQHQRHEKKAMQAWEIYFQKRKAGQAPVESRKQMCQESKQRAGEDAETPECEEFQRAASQNLIDCFKGLERMCREEHSQACEESRRANEALERFMNELDILQANHCIGGRGRCTHVGTATYCTGLEGGIIYRN